MDLLVFMNDFETICVNKENFSHAIIRDINSPICGKKIKSLELYSKDGTCLQSINGDDNHAADWLKTLGL